MTKTLNTCRLAIYGTIRSQRELERQSPPTLAIYGERSLVGLLTDLTGRIIEDPIILLHTVPCWRTLGAWGIRQG